MVYSEYKDFHILRMEHFKGQFKIKWSLWWKQSWRAEHSSWVVLHWIYITWNAHFYSPVTWSILNVTFRSLPFVMHVLYLMAVLEFEKGRCEVKCSTAFSYFKFRYFDLTFLCKMLPFKLNFTIKNNTLCK